MTLTPEQADKVRALHAEHVSAAAKLEASDADAMALNYENRWREHPDRARLTERWRKAHTAFYQYVDTLAEGAGS